MKSYILKDLNNPDILKIEQRSHGGGTICEAPKGADDIDVITLVVIEGKTSAYIDQNKINLKQQRLHDESIVNAKIKIRKDRDKKLKDTDFYVLVDAPITSTVKSKYKLYRKYLRSYPDTVVDFLNESPKTFEEWNV